MDGLSGLLCPAGPAFRKGRPVCAALSILFRASFEVGETNCSHGAWVTVTESPFQKERVSPLWALCPVALLKLIALDDHQTIRWGPPACPRHAHVIVMHSS